MSDKPGLIRRFFRFIGKLAHGVRVLINMLFLLLVVALRQVQLTSIVVASIVFALVICLSLFYFL
ncbi:hypothetical protein, partial [Porticoccus sp.]